MQLKITLNFDSIRIMYKHIDNTLIQKKEGDVIRVDEVIAETFNMGVV